MSKAAPGDFWIGIFDRRDHAFDSRFDQRVSAWRRAPLVSVGLQRNISSAAASLVAGLLQGHSFGVFDLVVEIKTFAGDLAVRINNDRADERSRADFADALRGELQRALHHLLIDLGKGWHVGIRHSAAKCL